MRARSRWLLIAVAGCGSLLFVIIDRAPRGDARPPPAVEPAQRAQSAPTADAEPCDRLPERPGIRSERGELFGPRTWTPPPAEPATLKPAAPAPPLPPPNPYRFAGTSFHDGELATFLATGDRVVKARAGDTLEGGFKVESVSRDAVVLVYSALGTRYRIDVESKFADDATAFAQRGAAAAGATAPASGTAGAAGAATKEGTTTGVGW